MAAETFRQVKWPQEVSTMVNGSHGNFRFSLLLLYFTVSIWLPIVLISTCFSIILFCVHPIAFLLLSRQFVARFLPRLFYSVKSVGGSSFLFSIALDLLVAHFADYFSIRKTAKVRQQVKPCFVQNAKP